MSADAPEQAPAPDAIAPPERPPAPSTDDDLIREYAVLTRANRDMDAQKAKNNQRIRDIEQRVLDIFEGRGQRAVDLVGVGNLHLKKYFGVKVKRFDGDYSRDATEEEKAAARSALARAGLREQLKVNFNLNSIKGLYSEWDKQNEHAPEELEDGFHVESGYKLNLTT